MSDPGPSCLIIKKANVDWNLAFVMTDNDDKEIQALEEIFQSKMLYCVPDLWLMVISFICILLAVIIFV